MERALVKGVKAPYGDYRDWSETDSWSASIAHHLKESILSGAV